MKKTTTAQGAMSKPPTQIDESTISRFRTSKAEGLKALEKSGLEAGICFATKHAEYNELRRLERWRDEVHRDLGAYIRHLGLSGLADVLSGGEGQGDDVLGVIQELGGTDADDEAWLESFVEGALRQFSLIKTELREDQA